MSVAKKHRDVNALFLKRVPVMALAGDQRLKTNTDPWVYQCLLTFGNFSNPNVNCFPSFKALAERAGFSRSTVFESVDRLEAAGWVTKTPTTVKGAEQGSNKYTFPRWEL
jgi:DNA-binding MarR family transcriptional regulator